MLEEQQRRVLGAFDAARSCALQTLLADPDAQSQADRATVTIDGDVIPDVLMVRIKSVMVDCYEVYNAMESEPAHAGLATVCDTLPVATPPLAPPQPPSQPQPRPL